MDLYILRHAIAVERGTPDCRNDFDRPLTPEGEQKLRRVIKAMRQLRLSFDLILTSPFVRARETADLVAEALSLGKKLEVTEALGADSSPLEFVAELRQRPVLPDSLLLVGHEPFLSTLISLLTTGATRTAITLKKAGLCMLTIESLRAGRCAQLEWLLTPRQMSLMN